jgi:hypothetical protein
MSSRRIKTHPSLPRSLQLTMLACRAFALSGPAGFQMVLRPLRRAYLVTRTFARDTELFIVPTTSFGGDPDPCSPGVAGPDLKAPARSSCFSRRTGRPAHRTEMARQGEAA